VPSELPSTAAPKAFAWRSPCLHVLKELVEHDGETHFNSITDEDLVLDLDLEVGGPLDPEEPEDEFVRMEFEREAEDYESLEG
jgi:hypothetical protein